MISPSKPTLNRPFFLKLTLIIAFSLFALFFVSDFKSDEVYAQNICEFEGGTCCQADSEECNGNSSPLTCGRGESCCFGSCAPIGPAPTVPPSEGCSGDLYPRCQDGGCGAGRSCKKSGTSCKCIRDSEPPPPATTPTETPPPPPSLLTPFPGPYVPCNETRPEEFHSLRPYQASPCNQDLEDIALFCGNDLVLTDPVIILKTFFPGDFTQSTFSLVVEPVPGGNLQTQITPVPPELPVLGKACRYCSGGFCQSRAGVEPCIPDINQCVSNADCNQECIDNGDGTETCKFNVERERDIAVDLLGAYLPIMGNTELVVNSRRQPNPEELDNPEKVNEYVSWYLNGLIGRAEYDPPESSIFTGTLSPGGRSRIVDYSGPLKRLLPFESQTIRRIEEVNKALTSLDCNPNADPRDPNCIRHDQYIGCHNLIGNPTHCYPDRTGVTERRLSYWENQFPPLRRSFTNFSSYVVNFQNWRNNTAWKLFSYIPFSSTEDRMGEVDFGTYSIQPPTGGNFIILWSELVNQSPAELFFSHMQESFELADLFQQIYAPQEADLDAEPEPAVVSTSDFCDLRAVRSNPGDNLFPGELSATVRYEAQVTCDFCILDPDIPGNLCRCLSGEVADCQVGYDYCNLDYGQVDCNYGETCGNDCGFLPSGEFCDTQFYGKQCYPNDWGPCSGSVSSGNPNLLYCPPGYTCADRCSNPGPQQINLVQECRNDVLISFRTVTKTPLAKEVWAKLVAGPSSVFRKMFPQIEDEEGRPIRRLWDIPGATSVIYQVLTPGVSVSAGNPTSGRGDTGELYFPHIGGIHEYFLKCIQKTIRPQGFGEGCVTGPEPFAATLASGSCAAPPPASFPAGGGYCQLGTGYCSPSSLRKYFVEAGCSNPDRKARQASIICNVESGGNPSAINCACLQGGSRDYSIGLFQINLLYHCAVDAFDRTQPACVILDPAKVDECATRYFDPEENARYMVQISSCGENWSPWAGYTVACQQEVDSQ